MAYEGAGQRLTKLLLILLITSLRGIDMIRKSNQIQVRKCLA